MTPPEAHEPGADMPRWRRPKLIRCADHERAFAHVERGGAVMVSRLLGDLDLALGRDELSATGSRWRSALPCIEAIGEASGRRN